jgi:hypothetical protein
MVFSVYLKTLLPFLDVNNINPKIQVYLYMLHKELIGLNIQNYNFACGSVWVYVCMYV